MSRNISTSKNVTAKEPSNIDIVDILLNFPGIDFVLFAWITGTTTFIMEALILIGNGLVIAAILLDPLKNIRRCPSNHLVLSLAVADFMVGGIICFMIGWWYISIAAYSTDLFDGAKKGEGIGQFELVSISTANLLALGVDRLIAIKNPLHYSFTVTRRRIRVVIVLTWVYFFSVSLVVHGLLLYFEGKAKKASLVFNCHNTVAFVALVIVCWLVIHSLQKQSNAMKRISETSNVLRNVIERERKVTRGTIVITVVYVVCFIPFLLSQILESVSCFYCLTSPAAFLIFQNIAISLVFFNSLVNPYIYAFRLPKYLEAFKYLAKKLFFCRKSRVAVVESLNDTQVQLQDMSREENTRL